MRLKRIAIGVVALGVTVTLCVVGSYGVLKFKAEDAKERIVAKLKRDVARDLHDPESVRFRDLKLLSESDHLEGAGKWLKAVRKNPADFMKALREDPASLLVYDERLFALCGQLNAKNRMGAYVGYTDFYIANTDPAKPFVVIEGLGWDKEFIGKMCKIGAVVDQPNDDRGM